MMSVSACWSSLEGFLGSSLNQAVIPLAAHTFVLLCLSLQNNLYDAYNYEWSPFTYSDHIIQLRHVERF